MKRLDELNISPTPWRVKSYNAFQTIDDVCDAEGREFIGAIGKNDSKLVASAPKLYAALYEAMGTCRSCDHDCSGCMNSKHDWIPMAREAMKLAAGE